MTVENVFFMILKMINYNLQDGLQIKTEYILNMITNDKNKVYVDLESGWKTYWLPV